MKFEQEMCRHRNLTEQALRMGGLPKLEKRRQTGVLNARERVEYLLDTGTWFESGRYAKSADPTDRDSTPGDGKITGFGRINGRLVAVDAYDFTVKGSSSGSIGEKKVGHIRNAAMSKGLPIVFLGESSGARMPDVMGAEGMAKLGGPDRFLRQRQTPWVSAILGPAYGSAAWHACVSDFNVMRKGAIMAVSSPALVSLATHEEVNPEELGGWRLHSETTGFADQVVDTDEEALDAIKKFLSYMPSHHMEEPPVCAGRSEFHYEADHLLDIIPDNPRRVYDVRSVIRCIIDDGDLFELKSQFGRSMVTGLARLNGRTVGIIANNPMFKGGAIDAKCCSKVTSFLVLCDSFNIPVVFLVDQPGFLIGMEAERAGMVGRVINWMNALSLVTVPKVMIITRKSYGQGFVNMGGGGMVDESAAWWTAEISFMDPVAATSIVYGIGPEDATGEYHRKLETMDRPSSAYEIASVYGIGSVIDPRETREFLIQAIDVSKSRCSGGIGKHLLSSWPTSY